MTLLPGKCPACGGGNDHCEKCGGTGKVAFMVPDDGPVFTRRCPDCGWTNGAYFPQPGMWVPTDGQPCRETYQHNRGAASDFCMLCERDANGHPKHGHMIWQRLDREGE